MYVHVENFIRSTVWQKTPKNSKIVIPKPQVYVPGMTASLFLEMTTAVTQHDMRDWRNSKPDLNQWESQEYRMETVPNAPYCI